MQTRTFPRTLETGVRIRVQRYRCKDCNYSFETWSPSYEYGTHYLDVKKKNSTRGRVKTSLRKTAYFFDLIGRGAV